MQFRRLKGNSMYLIFNYLYLLNIYLYYKKLNERERLVLILFN